MYAAGDHCMAITVIQYYFLTSADYVVPKCPAWILLRRNVVNHTINHKLHKVTVMKYQQKNKISCCHVNVMGGFKCNYSSKYN